MTRLSHIPFRVLVGPTAAGKTDVIHELAGMYGTGVISADAMMIYRGMDIGTAKPTVNERVNISYAGLDLADPDQSFSAHDYLVAVEKQLTGSNQPEQWLIAGGTGLYVKCLLAGLGEFQGPNVQIRNEAEGILTNRGFPALIAWCNQKVPDIEATLPVGDVSNPRRWIRAVERGLQDSTQATSFEIPANTRVAGLSWNRTDLEQRIIVRVKKMYASGLLEEVAILRQRYAGYSETAVKAIGYEEAGKVLDGSLTVEEAINSTIIRTRKYAKRQMTWFRNQFNTFWIEVTPDDSIQGIARRVAEYWNHHG